MRYSRHTGRVRVGSNGKTNTGWMVEILGERRIRLNRDHTCFAKMRKSATGAVWETLPISLQ